MEFFSSVTLFAWACTSVRIPSGQNIDSRCLTLDRQWWCSISYAWFWSIRLHQYCQWEWSSGSDCRFQFQDCCKFKQLRKMVLIVPFYLIILILPIPSPHLIFLFSLLFICSWWVCGQWRAYFSLLIRRKKKILLVSLVVIQFSLILVY